ncbi:PAS domain-containing protein [Novosphingobium taihuense]|uniref:histidine kinase n=1 Tax=Novosphingobium taihuense TaxID=260085 RepID=A0A7W7ADK3_9SPHN|nr:PAS domain-containing protein [Novosphingobium taihuense]MBB4614339.1 PAS domain S-box-containing protein [Novosphingobium taihuense]TWH86418.1 PAS domain S-box-containing protein [Novosphingobium taihuense]
MLSKAELSPESLSLVIEQSTDCVKLVDPQGNLLWINPNGLCAMEIDNFELLSGREWAALWPEDAQPVIRDALASASSAGVARLEAFCPTAKGTPRWWEVSVSAVRGPDGEPAGYISVSRDVSQLHADQEALKILLSEMRHRLKNSFAMVCAMLRTVARGNAANTEFAIDMVARISALATAQTLFDGEAEETDLHALLSTLILPFRTAQDTKVVLDCPGRHEINRREADVISLVVGELTVNSTKHGAIGHGGTIALSAMAGGDDAHHVIIWQEQSVRPVAATSRSGGQGLTLIERICAARGGTFGIDWQDSGLVATLSLPKAA